VSNEAAVKLPPAAASVPTRSIAAQFFVKHDAPDLDTGARHRSTRKRRAPKWYQEYESVEEVAEEVASDDSECTEVSLRIETPCQVFSLLQRPVN
jgi:hypothetical protein